MSLTTRRVLTFFKTRIEEIEPKLGRVHSTLLASPDPNAVITDFKFTHADGKKGLKFFILRPGPRSLNRSTTGGISGFYDDLRTVIIQCFISMPTGNPGAKDAELEDAVDAILNKLFTVDRLEDRTGENTYSPGEVRVSPITVAKVSNTTCLLQEITTIVGDRRQPIT